MSDSFETNIYTVTDLIDTENVKTCVQYFPY